MGQLEELVRLVIQRNEPEQTVKVLSKVVTPKGGKVFLNLIFVINNITSFSISIQPDSVKQSLADDWGAEISKKIEKTLGVEVVYSHNTLISEKQYKEKKIRITKEGFH